MVKKCISVIIMTVMILSMTAGCNSPVAFDISGNNAAIDINGSAYKEAENNASNTPFGAYPDTIYYTLGKMTSDNNSNMPKGDTYEDNVYTRYIKDTINVQNVDAFEAEDGQYDTKVSMAVAMKDIPDIMVVSNPDTLSLLIENDMIEDLSESYEKCLSPKIKSMYESYGDELLSQVTFDGKIMAFPETNITDGPNLLWLRKDWMDKLGLKKTENISDAVDIIKAFVENGMGDNENGNTVGLVCDTSIAGECGYSREYLLDIIFASFDAYPKQWLKEDDGSITYGSVTDNAKQALAYIHELYEENVIDNNFLLRTTANIIELIENGHCGSFFGPWWAPNNPLIKAVGYDSEADWQPYLLQTDSQGRTSYHSQNPCYKYIVVRKGYEHPELAAKIVSVLFDKMRYECNTSKELKQYYQLSVEPTARPLSINIDYKNALNMCYQELCDVINNEKQPSSLNIMESSYYDACMSYLYNSGGVSKSVNGSVSDRNVAGRKGATSDQWAAYMSRIKACSVLSSANINVVNSVFFGSTYTMKSRWWRLKEEEKQVYIKIICGEGSIDEFDQFVSYWYQNGGTQITDEVSEKVSELKKYKKNIN